MLICWKSFWDYKQVSFRKENTLVPWQRASQWAHLETWKQWSLSEHWAEGRDRVLLRCWILSDYLRIFSLPFFLKRKRKGTPQICFAQVGNSFQKIKSIHCWICSFSIHPPRSSPKKQQHIAQCTHVYDIKHTEILILKWLRKRDGPWNHMLSWRRKSVEISWGKKKKKSKFWIKKKKKKLSSWIDRKLTEIHCTSQR